jgi:hypothetical protein
MLAVPRSHAEHGIALPKALPSVPKSRQSLEVHIPRREPPDRVVANRQSPSPKKN